MRNILSLVMGILCAYTSLAQNQQLKGRVVDAIKQAPVAGARIDAGKQVIHTNENGEFTVNCTGEVTITITHSAFETYKQNHACSEDLTIALIPSFKSMDEIEVTTSSNTLSSPRSTVKLKETELKRSTGLFLDDVINTNVPGVIMERRSISGGQQLNIRGYGNGIGIRGINSNFDIQGTKIYLNGIPLTDAEGITVMDDIDFASLGNVEVIKGPSGTLHGFAIAGVVNLHVQKAEKNMTTAGQDLMVGSDGLLRTTTRLAISENNSSFLVNYGHQKYNGFMPHAASHKNFVNLSGDFQLSQRQSISSYIGFADSYDERNGELTRQQYAAFDYSGNPAYIKNNAHSAVKTFRAGLAHHYSFTGNFSNTTAVFGTAQNMDNSSAGGWTDKQPINYGIRTSFMNHFRLSSFLSLSGITGMEIQKMNAQVIGYGMGADSNNLSGYNIITNTRSNQATSNLSSSFFTQWTIHMPYGLRLEAGVGVNSMKLHLEDRLWSLSNNRPGNEKLRIYENKYSNLASPSIALNKSFGEAISVYASYSTASKAPVSSNILISATGQLNKGLQPEKASQYEIGARGNIFDQKIYVSVAGFVSRFQNKFSTVAVANPSNTATLYTYIVNAGTMNNKGLEMLVKYNAVNPGNGFITSFRPFANLTLNDFTYGDFTFQRIGKNAQNKDSLIIEDYSGKEVAGTPSVIFNTGFDLMTGAGLYGNVHFNYRSGMFFTSDGLNKTEPYSLLNAKLGYKKSFSKVHLDVFAGANNITGEQYYQMVFVNQLPDAYIPANNRINYFSGVSLSLDL